MDSPPQTQDKRRIDPLTPAHHNLPENALQEKQQHDKTGKKKSYQAEVYKPNRMHIWSQYNKCYAVLT